MDRESLGSAKSEQSLRSIAILLHTLPSRTHRALIGQLDGESKRKVACELESIGEIDVMEQHRVLSMMLDQLHAETDRVKKVESEIQDEIFIGRARVAKKPASTLASSLNTDSDPVPAKEVGCPDGPETADRPEIAERLGLEDRLEFPKSRVANSTEKTSTELHFLVEMQLNDAAMLLANESAQTIAIALSSIPRHTASMLMPKMPLHLQGEAISRMEQMDEVPAHAVSEVASHLKRQMMTHESTVQISSVHQPNDHPVSRPVSEQIPQPVSSIPVTQSGAMIYEFPRYTTNSIADRSQATSQPIDQASGLTRQIEQQHPFAAIAPQHHSQPQHSQQETESKAQQEAEANAAKTDQTLQDLPPQTLCRALGYATTRQAFLVLCGLPNEHAELILGMLPRRKARKVQADMRRMGKLHLSEIDEAKKAVAEIAVRMALGEQDATRTAVA